MAISKRLRFEVFRRDNYTCRYCGAKAPDAPMRIDHVLPVALGGTDDADNLVTACQDCNSGKTSIAPGSPLVAEVEADALRWAEAVKAASGKASADHAAVGDYREKFYGAWHSYTTPAPMDETWRSSIESFRSRGLPVEMLVDAAHKAMSMSYIKPADKFRYMCGIAWSAIRKIERDARETFQATPSGSAHERLFAAFDTAAAQAAQDDEWVEPSAKPVVDAIAAVWLATWQHTHEADPPAELEPWVREQVAELYPEEIGYPSGLMAAAEDAASRGSANLLDYYDDGEDDYLLRNTARSYFRGWAFGAYQRGRASQPAPDQWVQVALMARYADGAGYARDRIAQAAYQAGTAESAVLTFFTFDQAAGHMGPPTDEEVSSLTPTQHWVDGMAGAAELDVARSTRRRPPPSSSPWSPEGDANDVSSPPF